MLISFILGIGSAERGSVVQIPVSAEYSGATVSPAAMTIPNQSTKTKQTNKDRVNQLVFSTQSHEKTDVPQHRTVVAITVRSIALLWGRNCSKCRNS